MAVAARVDDPITHSEAHSESITQMLEGVGTGILIGAALIGLTVLTGGTDLLVLGAAVAAGGTVLSMGGKGFIQGANAGAKQVAVHGHIKTGSADVFINGHAAAAACLSMIDCDQHSGPQKLAEGSRIVLLNAKMASRVGDRSVCDGVISAGSPNVFIGGPTGACAAINREVPDWELKLAQGAIIVGTIAQFVGTIISGVGIVRGIMAAPAFLRGVLAARAGAGLLGSFGFGAAGSHYAGQRYGEGSWQQEAAGTVSALVGGGLIGKASERFGGMQQGRTPTDAEVADLKAATNTEAATEALKPSKKMSPCVAGVKDLQTGDMTFGSNKEPPPENLHPALEGRNNDYRTRNDGGAYPGDGGLGYPAKVEPGYKDGAHAEINALNKALWARDASNRAAGLDPPTETNLNDFLIHNINMKGEFKGSAMPRCRSCYETTYGAQVTPDVAAAETRFYAGMPEFMPGVASAFRGPQGLRFVLPAGIPQETLSPAFMSPPQQQQSQGQSSPLPATVPQGEVVPPPMTPQVQMP